MTEQSEVIEQEPLAETEDPPEPSREVALRPAVPAVVARDEIGVADLLEQAGKIEQAMHQAMRKDVHYGTIPGTQKPTLLKPGAQKLCVLFRLSPTFQTERDYHDDGHFTVVSHCTLTHIPTGLVVAGGDGLCTTRESRYAYRNAMRTCPSCGGEFIRQGKTRGDNPVDQFYCYRKIGGCGWTANEGTEAFDLVKQQEAGKKENPDLADMFNTVLKMANKRALVDAVINGTAASDVFTQDVEDGGAGPFTGGTDSVVDSNLRHAAGGDPRGTASETARDDRRAPASAGAWTPPKDAAEMLLRFASLFGGTEDGQTGRETALDWIREAAGEKHGVGGVAEIADQNERREFLVLVGRVLRDLETEAQTNGDLAFRTDGVRQLVAAAFKKHLEVDLIGPQWRLDPSEETLPTWEQKDAEDRARWAADHGEDVDIPFGE